MDFEIPEWGNDSFSYHFMSSLDQTIIDTAISNAGDKRKKRKKKSNTDDGILSPNKKLNQNNLDKPKTTINSRQTPKDENEVAGNVKLSKKKKLKTDLEKHSSIQKNVQSIDESKEFKNADIINDNTLIEKSPPFKKSKSKKKKKGGKNNKYKELYEKQQTERNKLITPSENNKYVSTMQKSNSTMAWNISNNIDSENKTPSRDLTITDSIKSKESYVITKENKKKKLEKESSDNKKDSEILDTETTEILHQIVSRKPIVKNEDTEKEIQTEIKTVKKRKKKKKKNKIKVIIGEDEDSQEKVDVTAEINNISKIAQNRKKRTDLDEDNFESKKLANETEIILNKTEKKRKNVAQKDSEEGKKKKKKKKSAKVSFEKDLEVIEGCEDEDFDDTDLKAELERYLGELKSKTTEELFASDSEDEMTSDDKGNESKDEWESLEEDDDEPGDDLESSGDVKEEVGDDMKESNEEKADIQRDMEGENIDIQNDNDSEDDNGSTLDDENDTDSNEDEIDNDSNEDEIDNEGNEHENDTDTNEIETETDDNEDENEADMDSSESEEEAKKVLNFEDESSEDNKSTSILVKNKDGKKKKFDSEKLSALLQESESIKVPPKKLSPADALRQKMSLQLNSARFRLINEQLYTSTGDDAKELFGNDPEAFQVYHEGYKSQVAKWPINPLDLIIKSLQTKPAGLVVADFGCGEAVLSRSVPQKKVFSLDLAAACEGVIVTDMAHTPLKTASVDIAVFCLSLMGTNIKDYLYEANRVLKQEGILKIAEVESRFNGDFSTFIKVLEKYGFKCTAKDISHQYFFLFDFKKTWVPKKSFSLPDISLKPCIYKKR